VTDGGPGRARGAPPVTSARAMGVDLGTRRIGLALTDRAATMAFPAQTLTRTDDPAADRAALVAAAVEAEVATVVVGLPLSLDGTRGPAARAAAAEAAALATELAPLGIAVETADERLTTVSADRALAGAGHRVRARRRRVDSAAAAVLLGAWLDAR